MAGLANGLAHEINNPLAIISGFSQQIDDMLSKDQIDKPRVRRIIKRMVFTCDRIHHIICGLQDFSRSAGDDPIREESRCQNDQ